MWKQLIIEIKTILDKEPHLGGDLNVYSSDNIPNNILIELPDGVSSSLKPSGIALKGVLGEDIEEGALCYLNSDKKWYISDSNNEATLPSMGICSQGASADSESFFILEGEVQYPSQLFSNIPTNGITVYSSATGISNDISSLPSNFIHSTGTLIDDHTLLYTPDYVIMEKV